NVDLGVRRQSSSAANGNEKRKFHSARDRKYPRPFYNNTLTVCQEFTAALRRAKVPWSSTAGERTRPRVHVSAPSSKTWATHDPILTEQVRDLRKPSESPAREARALPGMQRRNGSTSAGCEFAGLCYVRVQISYLHL